MLEIGTPVFLAHIDNVRYGVIESKSKILAGWQFYRVHWAGEKEDTRDYRADKLKLLDVNANTEKLQSVAVMASNIQRHKERYNV